jgi:hypothetical protein
MPSLAASASPLQSVVDLRATMDGTMQVSKEHLLAVLARTGRQDLIEQAKRDLPEMIDTDRDLDEEHLLKYGLTRGQLIDRMGGSP